MKLIKKLGTRKCKNGGNNISVALFFCEHCKKEVERQLKNGLDQHTCGCVRVVVKKEKMRQFEKKERSCLMCNKRFISKGPHNRRCGDCNDKVDRYSDYYPVAVYRHREGLVKGMRRSDL